MMNGRYQLLDDEESRTEAQHSHEEAGDEMAGRPRTTRATLAVMGAGLLLFGVAATVFQRGGGRSTAEPHHVMADSFAAVEPGGGGGALVEFVGGDRDAHGCIVSASYVWCSSASECIRPWEHNLTSEHEIAQHCGNGGAASSSVAGGVVGNDRDAHGCIASAGYRWCASTSECIRPWEHHLTSEHEIAQHCGSDSAVSSGAAGGERAFTGGDRDAHGCIGSAGYVWCASASECFRPWEHNLISEHDFDHHCGHGGTNLFSVAGGDRALVGNDRDAHGCVASAGYRWCASTSECIRPWEHHLMSEHEIEFHCSDRRFQYCNCPPTDVMWQCSEDQYQRIMNGTDCAYYSRSGARGGH